MSGIDDVMKAINKGAGSEVICRANEANSFNFRRVPTGILGLDLICGANDKNTWGVPSGRIIQFWGESSSGKTTAALSCIKSVQAFGDVGAFVSTEGAWDFGWARAVGVDLDTMLLSKVSTSEQTVEVMKGLVRTPGIGCIVLDSVAMMAPSVAMEKDIRTGGPSVGADAKLTTYLVKSITSALNEWDITDGDAATEQPVVILLNQIRDSIGALGDPSYAPGGRAKDHQASISVRFRVGKKQTISLGKNRNPVVGNIINMQCTKNKTWPPHRKGSCIIYGNRVQTPSGVRDIGEIDSRDELLSRCLDYNIVEQAGAWYSYNSERFQGRDGFLAKLTEQPEMFDELISAVYEQAFNYRSA